jgi:formate-dependent nitrite reductase cytochrome c552 subunit
MTNRAGVHGIHSFGNCVGCHMPRIAKSAEIGDIRSHTFVALLPEETIKDPTIPNSCTACHKHKDADLRKLQEAYDLLTQRPAPVGKTIAPVSYQ